MEINGELIQFTKFEDILDDELRKLIETRFYEWKKRLLSSAANLWLEKTEGLSPKTWEVMFTQKETTLDDGSTI